MKKRKSSIQRKWVLKALLLLVLIPALPCLADLDSPMSVNVKNAPIRGVLETIASKAGLQLVMDTDVNANISISQNDMSGRMLLAKLASENSIDYSVRGNKLMVEKIKSTQAQGPSGDSHEILLHYAMASELVNKLSPVINGDGKLLSEDRTNKLIFIGSQKTFEKIKSLVYYFDAPQKQIMIEAIIVETSHNFLQQIGVGIGNPNSTAAISANTTTPGPKEPNGTFNAILGKINSNALNVKLSVAESKGDAKIVSRPKVVTLNNRAAKVESGVTYHIKTLSNVAAGTVPSAATSGNQGVVTGSVTAIDAALSLNILPLLIGNDQIKLTVDINDASPDLASSVDGIPGILKNMASTAVIIKNKQTAVIAGLVKQSKSKAVTGVPLLMDIPILGALFRSKAVSDTNNELVIFLTPTVDDGSNNITDPKVDPSLLVQSPLDPQREPASEEKDKEKEKNDDSDSDEES